MKLLFVEDHKADREGFLRSVKLYNRKHEKEIDIVECKSLAEAMEKLDDSFDGAIIDMKLGDAGGEGNQILKTLSEKNIRMPIVILTGTPGEADETFVHIEVKKKGEADNLAIIEDFALIHASGLTKVMGGRGLFEDFLGKVFMQNVLPQKQAWKHYGSIDSEKSEKALIRHVMNHLIQMVDLDEESCVPEEFYIYPPVGEVLRTGAVLKSKNTGDYYAVMNPLCDLTVRADGKSKARNVMLCKISRLDECAQHEAKSAANLKKELDKNKRNCYHALPKTSFFEDGYLDFESLVSVSKELLATEYEKPLLQISPAFMKDIAARFSSFYGRQGQPALTYA